MVNMSYCRFENTFSDLYACFRALENGEQLSVSEMDYAKRMRVLCEDYVEAFDDYCEEE